MPEVVGSATIRIIPDTSGFAATLQGQLRGLGGQAGAATGNLGGLNAQLTTLGDNLTRAGTRMTQTGLAMTYGVTRPLIRMAQASIGAAADFDEAVRTVAAVSEIDLNTVEGVKFYEDLSDAAREFGRQGKFSAIEVAQGFTDLARAGLDVQAIIATMPAVINVATAESISLADASDRLIQVFTGFGGTLGEGGESIFGGMKSDMGGLAGEFERLTDVIAKTSALTTTDITGLTDAFRYAGPVASQAGLSFEETAAALGLLAQSGFDATVGGTALRGIITRLAIPTQRSEEIFTKFGLSVEEAFAQADDVSLEDTRRELLSLVDAGQITTQQMNEALSATGSSVEDLKDTYGRLDLQIFDSTGNMIPLADVIEELRVKGARTGDIMKLFGQRAGPGLLGLMGQTPAKLREFTAELELAGGSAQRMADTIGESATIQFLMLKNALIDLAISIGESGVLDFFTDMASKIADWVKKMSDTNPEIFKFVFVLGALLAAMGPVSLIMGIMTKTLGGLVKSFRALLFISEFHPVLLTIAAAVAAAVGFFVLLYRSSEDLREAISSLVEAFGDALGPVLERVKGWFADTKGNANSLFKEIGDNLAPIIQTLADRINDFVQSGRLDEILDAIGTAAERAFGLIQQYGVPAMEGLARVGADLFALLRDVGVPILQGLYETAKTLAPIVGTILYAAFKVAWEAADLFLDVIELLLPALIPLADFISDNMIPVLYGLGAAFLYVKGAAAIGVAIDKAAIALFNAAAGVDAMIAAWTVMSTAFTTAGGGFAGVAAAIGTSVAATAAVIAIAVIAVGVLIKTVYERSEEFRQAVQGAWQNIQEIFSGVADTLRGLWNIIAGIFHLDGDQIVGGLQQVFDGLVTGILGGVSGLTAEVSRMLGAFVDTILEAFGNIPIIGPVFDLLRGIVNGLTGALGGLFDILKGIFSLDLDMISEGWGRVTEAFGAAWEMIENSLGDIGSGIRDFVTSVPEMLSTLGSAIWGALQQIPGLLGDLGAFLGPILADAFGAAWGWLSNAAGAVGDAIWNFITSTLPTALGDALNFVFGQVLPSIGDFFSNLGDQLPDIGETLRGWIVAGFDFLRDLPSIIWDAITGGGGAAASGAGNAIGEAVAPGPEDEQSLIQKIGEFLLNAISGAIEWLVGNLASIGGALLGGLNTLFTEWLPQAGVAIFNAVLEYGPTIIEGLLNMIVGLGQFIGTLAVEMGKLLWTVITESVSLIGDLVGPVGGWLIDRFVDIFRFVFDTLPSKVTEFLDRLPDLISSIFSSIADAISNSPEFIGSIAISLAEMIGGAFGRIGEFLSEWVPRIGTALLDALGSAFDWLKENGPGMLLNALKWIGIGIVAALVGIPYLIITEVIPRIVSAIGEFIPRAIEWLTTNGPLIFNWFAELPGKILSFMGDAAGLLVGAFVEFGPRVIDFFTGLPGTIMNAVWAVGEAIVGFIIDAANGKFGGLLDLFLSLPVQLVKIVGAIGSGLWEVGGAILGLILQGLSIAVPAIWDFMKSLPGMMWDAFLATAETLLAGFFGVARLVILTFVDGFIASAKFIMDLPGMIWGWLQDLGPKLWDAFQAAVRFVAGLYATLWGWLWDFFTGLPGTIWNLLTGLGEFIWTAFQTAVNFIAEAWPTVWEWLWTFFTEMPGKIVELLAGIGEFIWEAVKTSWEWLRDQIHDIFWAVVGFAEELPGQIVGFLSTAGEFIWNAIQTSWGWLKDQFLNLVDGVVTFFQELPGRVVSFLATAGETIWNGISATFDWLKARFSDIVDGVWTFFSELPGRIASTLTTAGETIWNVVSTTFNWLKDQITGVFQGVIDFIVGIPEAIGGVARGIADVFRGPINWVLEHVWDPFAGIVNEVASKFGLGNPMPTGVRIGSVPEFHTGGIVGEAASRTHRIGDSVMSNEQLALLQRGEAVIPAEVVANLSPKQMDSLRRGDYTQVFGDNQYNIGGFSVPNPFEAGKEFVGDAIAKGREVIGGVAASILETGYNNTIKPLLDTFRGMFPGNFVVDMVAGTIEGFKDDLLQWIRGGEDSFADHMAQQIANAGVPAGVLPEGFDIAGWKQTFAENKGPGSYPYLIQYLNAAGIPNLINSTYRPGGSSYHASSRAVDFGAPNDSNYDSPGLLKINQAFWPFLDGTLQELIYSGPGGRSDKPYGSRVEAQHHNHVHAALAKGGIINDAIVALLGESGSEVVLPLTNPIRALQLARSSGLFAILAQAASQNPTGAGVQTNVPTTTSPAPGEAGFLGGGPGNTYHIHGVTMEQVRAEIRARDEAAMRGRI